MIIYGLVDPRTKQLRYVGKTSAPLETRLRQHRCDTKRESTHKANWLKSVYAAGLEPDAFVIEEVLGDGSESEVHHISYFRSIGCALTNLSPGGEGRYGVRLTEEHKKRIGDGLRGKKQDPALVHRRTRMRKGSRHTASAIANMRAGHANRPPMAEAVKRKISNSLKGRKQQAKTIELRVAAHRGKKRSPDVGPRIAAAKRAARLFRLLVKSAVQHALPVDDGDRLQVDHSV